MTEVEVEVEGIVKYVNSKNKKYFRLKIGDGKEYRCVCDSHGGLEIEIGDIVHGMCRQEKDDRYGEQFYFLKEPIVILGEDEETISVCVGMGLKKGKLNLVKARSVMKQLMQMLGREEKVCYELDCMANLYMNKGIIRAYLNVLSLNQWKKLLKFWYQFRCQRKLLCLGLTLNEIQGAVKYYEDINYVYYKCLENIYAVASVDMEKCDRINDKLGKDVSNLVKVCGSMVRQLAVWLENSNWVAVPVKIVEAEYGDFEMYVNELKSTFNVAIEFDSIYLPYPYQVETYVAQYIATRVLSLDDELQVSEGSGTLTREQQLAVEYALQNNICCISGAAGTGKTTVIRAIVEELERHGKKYQITSFTGKAVAKLREVLGPSKTSLTPASTKAWTNKAWTTKAAFASVATMNRLMVLPMELCQFEYLIIDEASMVTTPLFYQFIQKFSQPIKIIFVGDPNQLPPIGWGTLFEQLLRVPLIPKISLKQIHRTAQSEENGILLNANRIIEMADKSRSKPSKFEFHLTNNFKHVEGKCDTIISLLQELLDDGLELGDLTILTPYNKDLTYLNQICQLRYNPATTSIKDHWENEWKVGDRVMMKKNHDEVKLMNGEVGLIKTLTSSEMTIQFKGATHKFFLAPQTTQVLTTQFLQLAYAISIHRSQGSEWPNIIIYLPTCRTGPNNFINRRLLYTAITRASKRVWCVGAMSDYVQAVATDVPERYDNLARRLVDHFTIRIEKN